MISLPGLVHWRGGAVLLAALALGACSLLKPAPASQTAYYALELMPVAAASAPTVSTATLIVNPPTADAGFDSPHMIYQREPGRLQRFAASEWVDPPARMLAPLLVSAAQASGVYRAVAMSPGASSGERRLDTEILRLQQEFDQQPSRVRFRLRAWLVDDKSRRVVATRDFEASASAPTEDPAGGVRAANIAVQSVMRDLARFLQENTP